MQKLLSLNSNPRRCAAYFLLLLTFSFPTNALASVIQIGSETQLLSIGTLDEFPESADYELTASFNIAPASSATYISEIFSGTFDGNGHTISGLTRPLFNQIEGSYSDDGSGIAKVLNLRLSTSTEFGVSGRGILANDVNAYTRIDNVGTSGEINSADSNVGGLVGVLNPWGTTSQIVNSFSTASVTGNSYVGGLVGYVGDLGTISDSYSTGSIQGGQRVGGLVGYVGNSGTITNSYATGTVEGTSQFAGGLVGELAIANVSTSYATGSVTGIGEVGGLIGGSIYPITIDSSYATGSILGNNNTGGLIGLVGGSGSTISNSYSRGTVQGGESTGGLVGNSSNSIIENSFVQVVGNLTSLGNYLGGLIGQHSGTQIRNSYVSVDGNISSAGDYIGGLVGIYQNQLTSNSDIWIGGNIQGFQYVGGIAGSVFALTPEGIDGVTARVLGSINGNSFVGAVLGSYNVSGEPLWNPLINAACSQIGSTAIEGFECGELTRIPELPSILEIVNTSDIEFAVNNCINNGFPYLLNLSSSYPNLCSQGSNFRSNFISLISPNILTQPKTPTALSLNNRITSLIPEFKTTETFNQNSVKFTEVTVSTKSRLFVNSGEKIQFQLQKSYFDNLQVWLRPTNGKPVLLTSLKFSESGEVILPAFSLSLEGTYALMFVEGASTDIEDLIDTAVVGEITIIVEDNS